MTTNAWKAEFPDEETGRNYLLSKISNKLMAIAAFNLRLERKIHWTPSKKKVEKWKQRFLEWPFQKFRQALLPYYMSGSLTTHIYVLEKFSVKQIQAVVKDQETFEIYGSFLKDLHPEFFYTPDIMAMLLKIPLKVKYELVEKAGKLQIQAIHPFEDVWVVFHPKLEVIEIRTRNSHIASRISKRIKEELRINCRNIDFSLEEIEKFFKWISSISNSHIRFETGAISSAHYTSALKHNGTRESLLRAKEFRDAIEKGRIISAYGYIPSSHLFPDELDQAITEEGSKEDRSEEENCGEEGDIDVIEDIEILKGQIGFNVNFDKGKIYFSTALSEYEISRMIEEIVKLLDLDPKRTSLKRLPQQKLNPQQLDSPL
ncbi:MAG: hypothetical protein ACE5OZ_08215 [Candidatus Heimdallarchaeota archaeon]